MSFANRAEEGQAEGSPREHHEPSGRSRTAGLKRIRVNGADFAYEERGEGPAVVFLHGSLGTLWDFHTQIQFFAKQYRAIAYSRRFHPPNEIDPGERIYAIERHAEDLAALLEALNIAGAHLIGSSYGAYVLLVLLLRRPELARSVVLGEPPILPLLRHSPVGEILHGKFLENTIEPARQDLLAGKMEEGVRTFVDGVSGRRGSFDHLPPGARKRIVAAGPELKMEFTTESSAYMPQLSPDTLSRFSLPTLLLEGERSPKMFKLITNELELSIPNTERHTVPRTGHTMHTGNSLCYNDTILRFLQNH